MATPAYPYQNIGTTMASSKNAKSFITPTKSNLGDPNNVIASQPNPSPYNIGYNGSNTVSIYDPDAPEGMRADINAAIKIDRDRFRPITDSVVRFREYAAGKHLVILTDAQKSILRGILSNEFCDNICHQVLSEGTDRLNFTGWSIANDNDGDNDDDIETDPTDGFLSDLFNKNRLLDRSAALHYDSQRDADTAFGIGWDEVKGICFYREPWWDGWSGMFVAYDDEDNPVYAVKEWWEAAVGLKLRYVYFPDRIERYGSEDSFAWLLYMIPGTLDEGGDGGQWPVPWTMKDGSPLCIPVVHFPNTSRGTGNYGFSEIGGGVLGFQDQINDLHFAMSGAGRLTAYQIITIAGIKQDDDYDRPIPGTVGKFHKKAISINPGTVLTSTDPETVFGSIAAGDLSQLALLLDTKLTAVARMTRTPRHAITGGDWPSGEALNKAEKPAVGKATRQIKRFKACWQEVAQKAILINNAFGKTQYNADAIIEADFDDPTQMDIVAKSLTVMQMGANISTLEALRILGKTQEQAEDILAEMQDEAQANFEAQAMSFNAGTANGTQLPGRSTRGDSGDQGNSGSVGQ